MPRSGPSEALLEDGLFGGVGGQLGGEPVGGAGLVGVAELAQQLGVGGVVQVVAVQRAGESVQFVMAACGPET